MDCFNRVQTSIYKWRMIASGVCVDCFRFRSPHVLHNGGGGLGQWQDRVGAPPHGGLPVGTHRGPGNGHHHGGTTRHSRKSKLFVIECDCSVAIAALVSRRLSRQLRMIRSGTHTNECMRRLLSVSLNL